MTVTEEWKFGLEEKEEKNMTGNIYLQLSNLADLLIKCLNFLFQVHSSIYL